jgi:hypothetical protein
MSRKEARKGVPTTEGIPMSESAHVPAQDAIPEGKGTPGSATGETWDEVKSDYQVDPDGRPVPNSMDPSEFAPVEDVEDLEDDGEQ